MQSDFGKLHPTNDIFSRNTAPRSRSSLMESIRDTDAADDSAAALAATVGESEASTRDPIDAGASGAVPIAAAPLSAPPTSVSSAVGTIDKPKVKRKRRPPKNPWRKPKDMPKRPLSAYNLFFKERREGMMKANKAAESARQAATGERKKSNKSVGIGFANLAKTIASEWKTLAPDIKAPFEARAAVEKGRYDKEMLVWRAKQKDEKEAAAAEAKGGAADLTDKASSSTRPTVETTSSSDAASEAASRRPSSLMDISFPAQAKSSPTDMAQSGSLFSHSPMSLRGMPSSMDEMMMAAGGSGYPFQQATWQRQQQQREEMGWAGSFPFGTPSSGRGFGQDQPGPMSDLPSSSGSQQRMPRDDEASSSMFHRMGGGGMPDQRQQFMMMQFQQQQMMMAANMQGGGDRFDPLLGTPSSQRMGELGEQEPTSVPPNMGGRQAADPAVSAMHHSISEFGHQGLPVEQGSFAERRNTWSGMSQAQQDVFHQMQMERLQQEEEALQSQLQQHRRMYMEHQRQMQEERQRRSSLHAVDQGRLGSSLSNIEEMSAHRVVQHPDSWTELTPETPAKPRQEEPRSLDRMMPNTPASNSYPSTWFEADTNMEDARGNLSEELLRYSPDVHDGDLNQKLSGRTISSSSAPPAFFGGQPPMEAGLKEAKKPEGDLWNPIQLKEKERVDAARGRLPQQPDIAKMPPPLGKMDRAQSTSALPSESQQRNVDPSSVQALGMRLDDESVSFLANLRFGAGLNTPDGSPHSRDSR